MSKRPTKPNINGTSILLPKLLQAPPFICDLNTVKAFITTNLWKPVVKKDKETGTEKRIMITVKASLFSAEQVELIKNN